MITHEVISGHSWSSVQDPRVVSKKTAFSWATMIPLDRKYPLVYMFINLLDLIYRFGLV